MKQFKLLLLGAVSALLMLFVVFIPMRANAAVIENGKPNTLLREGKAIYKFTLEDDSLITMNWVKNNRELAEVHIYTDRAKTENVDYFNLWDASNQYSFALRRGTYYVEMFDGNSSYAPTTKVKFSWVSAGKYAGNNYSLATAKSLKANTLAQEVQVRKYNYTRWYKIKLTKTQRIFLENFNDTSIYDLRILDSKLQTVSYYYNSYDFRATEKLPKGTYYIIVPSYSGAETSIDGNYYAFTWK